MKKLLIFLLLVYSNLVAQDINQTTFSLSPKGFISSWLIKGPFTISEGVLRDKDYLISEGGETKNFTIQEISRGISFDRNNADNNRWFPIYANTYIISFPNYYKITSRTVAYGLCFVGSDREQDVIIKLGSDDGVKLFLNGKQIHNNPIYRGVSIDNDIVVAKLVKGSNPLLIKVDQGGGDWSYCLRIVGEENEPIKNLKVGIPYKFSNEEVLKTAISSFNINSILDKSYDYNKGKANTFPESKLVILITSEAGFPLDINSSFKLKLVFLNGSSETIEEFYNMDISLSEFTEKEVIYNPKNIQPGQYILRLVILDKDDNEIISKENIVFWN
jgi:hypothetical protein